MKTITSLLPVIAPTPNDTPESRTHEESTCRQHSAVTGRHPRPISTIVALLACLTLAGLTSTAAANGLLIPKDANIPPLAIKSQRVNIDIKDGVATARIEQVFKNNVDRDLEAVYVFPLPRNASISDFAMYINGKRMSGELVEKGKARKIYEDIVRRMKDPGLLEYMGGDLFRISVYPVPKQGEQRIELEYAQTLEYDAGLYRFVYPLRTGEKASRTLEDFTVTASLHSSVSLKSIYSPSHEIGLTRRGEHEAVIGFEEETALLDRDFVLYYSVSRKEFGLNLLTHATKGENGYFMMMLAPGVAPPDGKPLPKDVTFVFDTSGSMAGEKIRQAREALAYCIETLNKEDRFNVIRFSTDVEAFSPKLSTATAQTRKSALKFVEGIEARGGTAIDDALRAALAMDYDVTRPALVVFLTDGKPTVGETAVDIITANVSKVRKAEARLFVFGVGEKVNTHLLDRISGNNGGLSEYVDPGEDIEIKVSRFADKMSHPVLAKVAVEADGITLTKVHPRTLPDLFSGDQLCVFGRYNKGGHVAVRLLGDVRGTRREFVYEGTFEETEADNAFIPRLWATRRVGYLLDEIRLHGENAELKDEVIALSKEYGIMTPYTSYLVLENEEAYQQHGLRPTTAPSAASAPARFGHRIAGARKRGVGAAPALEPAMVPVFDDEAEADLLAGAQVKRSIRARAIPTDGQAVQNYLRRDSGTDAVQLSKAIRKYKEETRSAVDSTVVRHVGDRLFYLVGDRWVDRDYREDMKVVRVTFASEEYFRWVTDRPELNAVFALGEKVSVVVDTNTALVVE